MSTDATIPASTATQIVVQQQRVPLFGRFGKWLAFGLLAAIIALVSMYGRYQSYFSPPDAPQEKYHSLARYAPKKIAIINVSGAIMDAEEGFVKQQIDRVKEDSDVVAIVLRINSPGGTVTGSDYLYHHLREMVAERELPLVVSMGSVCASGGYYIAMAVGDRVDSVFAEPTTWTGSIGVIIPHYDLSKTLSFLRVEDDSIASGPYKQMGSPTKTMTPEERALLQAMVDDSFQRFKDIVTNGRPKLKDDAEALAAVTTGQIFTADQALEKGLVDKIGFIEAAITRAAELANVSTDDVRCVKYEKPPSVLGELLGSNARAAGRGGLDLATLFDLATPRAYYLWTWLPAATANTR
jgi:protease IV